MRLFGMKSQRNAVYKLTQTSPAGWCNSDGVWRRDVGWPPKRGRGAELGLNNLFPLPCLSYAPGKCRETIETCADNVTRATLHLEFALHQGNLIRCMDLASGLNSKESPGARATAEISRACASLAGGDAGSAAPTFQKMSQNGEAARARIRSRQRAGAPGSGPVWSALGTHLAAQGTQPPDLLAEGRPAPLDEAQAQAHELDLIASLAGDVAECFLDSSMEVSPDHFWYLSCAYGAAQRMLGGCVAADLAMRQGRYEYSAGIASTTLAVCGAEYPMLTAWAGMVIAIDMVHTGQDATAKDCFLKSFEILRKDSLYMPIAGLYRRLMGLPDACLRNRYPRQYRSVCNLAKRVEPLRTNHHERLCRVDCRPVAARDVVCAAGSQWTHEWGDLCLHRGVHPHREVSPCECLCKTGHIRSPGTCSDDRRIPWQIAEESQKDSFGIQVANTKLAKFKPGRVATKTQASPSIVDAARRPLWAAHRSTFARNSGWRRNGVLEQA